MSRNPNSGEEIVNEICLGDGVYASWDGANVWLRAPRVMVDNFIAVNVYNWAALRDYCVSHLAQRPQARHYGMTAEPANFGVEASEIAPLPGPEDDV